MSHRDNFTRSELERVLERLKQDYTNSAMAADATPEQREASVMGFHLCDEFFAALIMEYEEHG